MLSLRICAGLALQQCTQQAQQAAADLARLEWLHEGSLIRQGADPVQLGSWAEPTGITAQVVGDAGLVSGSTVSSGSFEARPQLERLAKQGRC